MTTMELIEVILLFLMSCLPLLISLFAASSSHKSLKSRRPPPPEHEDKQ